MEDVVDHGRCVIAKKVHKHVQIKKLTNSICSLAESPLADAATIAKKASKVPITKYHALSISTGCAYTKK